MFDVWYFYGVRNFNEKDAVFGTEFFRFFVPVLLVVEVLFISMVEGCVLVVLHAVVLARYFELGVIAVEFQVASGDAIFHKVGSGFCKALAEPGFKNASAFSFAL